MRAPRHVPNSATPKTRTALAVLGVAGLLAIAPAPVRAADWTPIGPAGGTVYTLAESPATPGLLFAGLSAGGVFKTSDGGATWSPARQGIEDAVFDLALHPSDPDTVYAASSHGVVVTRDGGATWQRSNSGLPIPTNRPFPCEAIALAPSAPDTLYLGSPVGIFKSTDGARTWLPARGGTGRNPIAALAVHPSDPGTALAGVRGEGLFRTVNGGLAWNLSSDGLGKPWNIAVVEDVAYDPAAPERIYAAAGHPLHNGVYRSDDGGATWAPAGRPLEGDGPKRAADDVAVSAAAPSTLLAATPSGLFRSTDGGETWTGPAPELLPGAASAVALSPHTAADAWAGRRVAGVFRSDDGGESWREANRGLDAHPLAPLRYERFRNLGLTADPRGNGRLYALGQDGALFATADWGMSWRRIETRLADPEPGGEAVHREVLDVRLDPTRPSVLFARVLFAPRPGEAARELLFRSTDSARTWSRVGASLPSAANPQTGALSPLHWDPSRPGRYYLRIRGIAYRSTDDGVTWSRWLDRLPGPLDRLAPTAGGTILFVSDMVPGPSPCPTNGFCPQPPDVPILFRSEDGGTAWTELDWFVDEDDPDRPRIFVHPSEPSVLFTLRDGDLFRSLDGGATFTPFLATPFEPLGQRPQEGRAAAQVADPVDPRIRYRTRFDGVERSADGGETWEPFADDVLVTTAAHGLVIPPGGPRVLFAATDAGIWARPLDGGPYPPTDAAPPPGDPLTSPELPGFRVWVRILPGSGEPIPTRREPDCIPETLCVSGAVPGRSEVFVRIVGPKPNGFLWPTLVKFTTSAVEIWIERTATGELRHYRLEGAAPGFDVLPGLFDRRGFPGTPAGPP